MFFSLARQIQKSNLFLFIYFILRCYNKLTLSGRGGRDNRKILNFKALSRATFHTNSQSQHKQELREREEKLIKTNTSDGGAQIYLAEKIFLAAKKRFVSN